MAIPLEQYVLEKRELKRHQRRSERFFTYCYIQNFILSYFLQLDKESAPIWWWTVFITLVLGYVLSLGDRVYRYWLIKTSPLFSTMSDKTNALFPAIKVIVLFIVSDMHVLDIPTNPLYALYIILYLPIWYIALDSYCLKMEDRQPETLDGQSIKITL